MELCERLGLAHPIVQGPFGGGLSSVVLAAAVSNAGGLGSFGANSLSPGEIGDVVGALAAATDKAFAINLWVGGAPEPAMDDASIRRALALMAPYYREVGLDVPTLPERFGQDYAAQVEAVLAARPPAVSFVFGVPDRTVVRRCRELGIVTIGTATTVDEALALEQGGVDAIVATGFEAGGHRASFLRSAEASLTGTLALVPQVVDAVGVPVIAAGGIADGRGVAAALALGAQAVQIGSAFLACAESGAPPLHKDMMFSEAGRHTALTRAFSGRLVRAIRNRFLDDMDLRSGEIAPYPVQNWLTGQLRKPALAQGRAELLSLQASQCCALLRHHTVAALMTALVDDMLAANARALSRLERSSRR